MGLPSTWVSADPEVLPATPSGGLEEPSIVSDTVVLSSSVSVSKSLYVTGSVLQCPVSMLVDTGSALTVLSTAVWKSLPCASTTPVKPVAVRILSVTGDSLHVTGSVDIPLSFGCFCVTHNVIVADITPPMILGLDFLCVHPCAIDLARSCLTVASETFPLTHSPQATHAPLPVCHVSLSVPIVVPGYSQIVVSAQVSDSFSGTSDCVLVEPNMSFLDKHSMAMAPTAVDSPRVSSGHTVPVRLLNLLPSATTIPSGTVIGQLTVCDIVPEASQSPSNINTAACHSVDVPSESPACPSELFDLGHLLKPDCTRISCLVNEFPDIYLYGCI